MSLVSWARGLSLRGRTLLVGGVCTAALIAVGVAVPIPYVAVGPGVTYDTLGQAPGSNPSLPAECRGPDGEEQVICVYGQDVPASAKEGRGAGSRLNMTTISVNDNMTLFAALALWATDDHTIAPREDFFAPNKTVEQVNQENAQLFRESTSAAQLAAERYVQDHNGRPYPMITFAGDIPAGMPSSGILDPNDQITAVDGKPVTDTQSLLNALVGAKPGQVVKVSVIREGKPMQVSVTLGQRPDDASRGFLGIQPFDRPDPPFSVNIELQDIGGPSAGLMFTLGLIDKLTPGDLTSGHFIAGTGEIRVNQDGTKPAVGAIGGIQLKEIAARDAGATIFLVPADNCQEAVAKIPAGLTLVKVSTLDDAMTALQTIAAGGAPVGC